MGRVTFMKEKEPTSLFEPLPEMNFTTAAVEQF